ncbi:hypothetical protein Sme01_72840 [Sphaerisporangium melleum]|uniref:Acyl-CoA carboxylase subunit epsilon n=1 Tax=Sphaerisporangium melleum TaxID=321316 RepID=A0A917RPQ3_9ACTN|nr:hypothetical protein [Sphaerisporangium melleum]GGL17882.1 hypothetical protein GCM10007964_69850 [Sphaerisporangium melleum]GII74808.1 hypothetical protein Sme01_72840 [Sphaerisporangium melleum]
MTGDDQAAPRGERPVRFVRGAPRPEEVAAVLAVLRRPRPARTSPGDARRAGPRTPAVIWDLPRGTCEAPHGLRDEWEAFRPPTAWSSR